MHTKRTGHSEFVDKTSDAAKPISLEAPKVDGILLGAANVTTDQNEGTTPVL